ncbi:MAG: cytochrome c [Betaproteobacteria bacterium]|nr:cytochrome c [Betaproteobacteria bacterium]
MKTGWIIIAAATVLLSAAAAAQSMQVPQPTPGLKPNPVAGKKIYGAHCAQCHGADLRGSTQGPPFLHPVYVPSHHGDVAFQLAVRNGSRRHHWNFGDMAPVAGISADEVAHITAYVRAEQRKAGVIR